jgi:hypothetical protein
MEQEVLVVLVMQEQPLYILEVHGGNATSGVIMLVEVVPDQPETVGTEDLQEEHLVAALLVAGVVPPAASSAARKHWSFLWWGWFWRKNNVTVQIELEV